MISIRVNELWLDIASSEVAYKITSPLFVASQVYGEFSDIPFTLARTPNTERALGWVGDVHRPAAAYEFDCEIFLSGSKLRDGKLTIISATATTFRAVFGAGVSRFARTLDTTKLSDLPFALIDPGMRPMAAIELVNAGGSDLTVYYLDPDDYEELYDGSGSPFHTVSYTNNYPATLTIEQSVAAIAAAINADYESNTVPFFAEVWDQYPSFIFLIHGSIIGGTSGTNANAFDIASIANADWGWSVGGAGGTAVTTIQGPNRTNPGGDQFLGAFFRTIEATCANPDTYVFPMIKNYHGEDTVTGSTDIYNRYVSTLPVYNWDPEYTFDAGYESGIEAGCCIVPMFKLKFIIEQCFAFLGYAPKGAVFEDDWFSSLVLYSNVAIDFTQFSEQEWFFGSDDDILYINPAHHMPDISLKEFFAELAKYIGIMFIYDQNKDELSLVKVRDLFKSTNYFDMDEALTEPLVINPQPDYKDGFVLGLSKDSNDSMAWADTVFFDDEVTFGAGGADLRTGFCWIFQDLWRHEYFTSLQDPIEDSYEFYYFYVPWMAQPTSYAGAEEKAKTGLKLLIWHGLQRTQDTTHTYPYASQIPLNAYEESVADQSLRFKSTIPRSYFDIIEDLSTFATSYSEDTVQSDYLAFYNALITARSAKAKIRLTSAQLKSIAINTIFRTKEGLFIAKVIEASIHQFNDIIEADVEFWVL